MTKKIDVAPKLLGRTLTLYWSRPLAGYFCHADGVSLVCRDGVDRFWSLPPTTSKIWFAVYDKPTPMSVPFSFRCQQLRGVPFVWHRGAGGLYAYGSPVRENLVGSFIPLRRQIKEKLDLQNKGRAWVHIELEYV